MHTKSDYEINCLAMAIVNHTNETNVVDVGTRQKNNDKCFDFAVNKIKGFLTQTQNLSEVARSIIGTYGRHEGKALAFFAAFQEAIDRGKNALFIGPQYVVMSTENYQRLVNQSKIEMRSILDIYDGNTMDGDLTVIDEIHPEPDAHQPTLFSEEEIEKCL